MGRIMPVGRIKRRKVLVVDDLEWPGGVRAWIAANPDIERGANTV